MVGVLVPWAWTTWARTTRLARVFTPRPTLSSELTSLRSKAGRFTCLTLRVSTAADSWRIQASLDWSTASRTETPTASQTRSSSTSGSLALRYPVADDAIADDAPSPWLPCPQCAGVWFKVQAVLERGHWVEDGTYEVDLESPPHVGAYVSNAGPDGAQPIECNECGHKFGLADVGYRVAGAEDDD
jgi:hypothetical protein